MRSLLQLQHRTAAAHASARMVAKRFLSSSHAEELLISAAKGHCLTGATSQAELVAGMVKAGIIEEGSRLAESLASLDRAQFLGPDVPQHVAYENSPRSIGHGMTMSTPQFHGEVLSALSSKLDEGNSALDIGCGNGYIACLFARMLGPTGHVRAVEAIEPILSRAKTIAETVRTGREQEIMAPIEFEECSDIMMSEAEGEQVEAYDAIYVAPAVETRQQVENLSTRLKPGGVMVVPVSDVVSGAQTLYRISKSDQPHGDLNTEKLMPCACQPVLHGKTLEAAINFKPKKLKTRKDELDTCKAALSEWKSDFQTQHGRKPTREDLEADDVASDLFARFVRASKLGCT